jgi:hypothetical protein
VVVLRKVNGVIALPLPLAPGIGATNQSTAILAFARLLYPKI